ncbi:MAG: orotate phosphoribosyltransferase [Alkaliphilus sp.]|nr:orotate phosphoribosyltransferase [bacterium AH-315-L21]PHS33859.1 MAG: orotate phosphoribosyltransferase [Alkaliphilus sp.]
MNKERILEILKETEVLLEGHFLLTSGKHSRQYMQCAKLLQYPKYTEEIARDLADKFKNEKVDIVIAPAVGGIIFGYEVARQLGAKNLFAERVNGKMKLRRGFEIPKGARVLVAEDVVTTGGSVKEVIEAVKKQGGEVVGVVVVVDRSNGTVEFGTKFEAALTTEVISYKADNCPLCKEGKSAPVKPGSRK